MRISDWSSDVCSSVRLSHGRYRRRDALAPVAIGDRPAVIARRAAGPRRLQLLHRAEPAATGSRAVRHRAARSGTLRRAAAAVALAGTRIDRACLAAAALGIATRDRKSVV